MGAFKRSYCLYFRGERESSNGATASILEEKGVSNRATAFILELNRVSGVVAIPFFSRRSSCSSILEEKGAFKQSYCLYFRGEGSLETELLPLF